MSKESSQNKWSLLLSLLLHLVLLTLLVVAFVPERYRAPGPVDPKAIIQVKTVSATALAKQRQARERQLAEQRLAKKRRLQRKQQAKLKRLRARQQAKQRRIAVARKAVLKRQQAQALVKRQKWLRQQQQLAKKKQQAKQLQQAKLQKQRQQQQLAKKKRQAKQLQQAKLQKQRQQLAQKMMAQQLQREAQQVQQQKARQQQGIINTYVPQILAAIAQKWLLPPGVNRHLSCLYRVNLAPGGVVISVELLNTSGNRALDRSASQAIWNASPLPAPKNPALFDKLRVLRLTMRPENVISNG